MTQKGIETKDILNEGQGILRYDFGGWQEEPFLGCAIVDRTKRWKSKV
jgi:hypothetical protein